MIDRNTASNFLLGMLENYITHHVIALVTLLATWLIPRVRRALGSFRALLTPRTDPWLRSVGSSKQTGSATLSDLPPRGNVVITLPSGELGIVGMPPEFPAGTAGALAMAAMDPPPFHHNNQWAQWEAAERQQRISAMMAMQPWMRRGIPVNTILSG